MKKVPGSMPGYANLVLFPGGRSITHIVPVYPAVRPGGLVSSEEAAHPAVKSKGTWCLLGETNSQLFLSHLTVLGLLWNF